MKLPISPKVVNVLCLVGMTLGIVILWAQHQKDQGTIDALTESLEKSERTRAIDEQWLANMNAPALERLRNQTPPPVHGSTRRTVDPLELRKVEAMEEANRIASDAAWDAKMRQYQTPPRTEPLSIPQNNFEQQQQTKAQQDQAEYQRQQAEELRRMRRLQEEEDFRKRIGH